MAYMGKGLGAIKEASEGSVHNLKIKNGESKVIRILTPPDEIISVWEHVEQLSGGWKTVTCLGKDKCPLCKAGKKASFKSYIAVLDRDDSKVKLFKASKKVGVQLLGLLEEYGDLRGRDFKIFRQGEKLETTYQFFPRDPSSINFDEYELPNVEEMVALKSVEEIKELMDGGTVTNSDDESIESEEQGEYPF